MSVYLAAAISEYLTARAFAERLRVAGIPVCSRWHDQIQPGQVDPVGEEERAELLSRNMDDLWCASTVVVLAAEGDPRATYWEAGYAACVGVATIWQHGPNGEGRCLGDAYWNVVRVTSLDEAYAAIVARLGRAA
jgi:hypothetical protein